MKKINVDNLIREYHNTDDPNGSYTGTPNEGISPTQDADDL